MQSFKSGGGTSSTTNSTIPMVLALSLFLQRHKAFTSLNTSEFCVKHPSARRRNRFIEEARGQNLKNSGTTSEVFSASDVSAAH